MAPEPKVTDTFISFGLAWVRFEPVLVNDGRYDIMVDRAHAWATSGPRYAQGRGLIVKKDGTVGVRVLETSASLLPINVLQAMTDLLEAHQKEELR